MSDSWCVLLISCSGREELLAMLATPPSASGLEREQSHPWTFVDEELEELDVGVARRADRGGGKR